MDFAFLAVYRLKMKEWKDRQIFGSCWKIEEIVEADGDTNYIVGVLRIETGIIGNQWKNQDLTKHGIVKIC